MTYLLSAKKHEWFYRPSCSASEAGYSNYLLDYNKAPELLTTTFT
jgi:hypothetical protein